jgi:adenylate cyclase
MLLTWSLGTAVPVVGIVIAGIWALAEQDTSATELALTMAVLGTIAIGVGLLATVVTARAVSGPVRAVRDALAEVERGRLDVEVRVDDGSELGRLEAGVNQMVRGLREREALRDLFGRHVGEDVARAALERGVELGGEVRDVGVLFVDVVGSTALAHEREPHEVVELLNRFFGVVVAVVDEHGGWINKFEGDAALAVFGAPAPLPDRDTRVLAAARTMAARLRAEVPELAAGIGASAGEAVAGNVGAPARFEYTVIGDPVNEAARLSELAKEPPGRVVVAARLLDAAAPAERARWRPEGERRLRGRPAPTLVAVPVDA